MIAKHSQRTADKSKIVAVETRRDSTSMKTIASLTLIYLPSTFVNTIFSTGFFDFGSDGTGDSNVNVDIWKLIIVASVLTTLAISVWIYLNKCVVTRLLRWAELDGPQAGDAANRPRPPAKILLDLPQRPGNRANDTVLEAFPLSRSQSLRDSQQMHRPSISPGSAQIDTENGARSRELRKSWFSI